MLFSHKALGLEIYQDGARMVVIGGSPHMPRLEAYYPTSFPPETMKISFREENVLNPASFTAKIREAHLRLLVGISRVSVSLPDTVGRVVLLDLETRFKTKEEGTDIIRWKLKKNFPFEINEMHLDYQVMLEKKTGDISVLVSLISRLVVHQYEDLLAEAGLQPNRIDFTTFNIHRFFSSRLEHLENAALIIWHTGILSILIFHNGMLEFYRSKEIPIDSNGANRFFREISSSFLAHKDKQPGYSMNEVFFVVSHDETEKMRGVIAEATGLEPVLLDAGRIVSQKEVTNVDARTLHTLTASIGAALRNL